jgi:hypothetical protein
VIRLDNTLRVRNAGSGHFRPRRLIVFSAITVDPEPAPQTGLAGNATSSFSRDRRDIAFAYDLEQPPFA